jgi:PDZ domain
VVRLLRSGQPSISIDIQVEQENIMKITALFFIGLIAAASLPGFAPADESLEEQNQAIEARLGLGVTSLPDLLKSHLPKMLDGGRGVLVTEVAEGSPAAKAGMKQHDVLIRYGDQDLYSPEQLVKRVRNDAPGREVEIQYVRAGELRTTKVKLGQQEVLKSILPNWTGFSNGLNIPWSLLRPEYWTEAQDRADGGTEWTSFDSLTVQKETDGSYLVRIVYKDSNGNSIGKQFKGTRQEIRDAINADNDLPESRKNQLLRTMDDRGRQPLRQSLLDRWQRDSFNWPNTSF